MTDAELPRAGRRERTFALLGSPPTLAALMWAGVHTLLSATGQAYPVRVLFGGWQMLPEAELRSDPLGSVWNLHIQPPLWNLLVGIVGWVSPLGLASSHRLVSLCTGMVLAAAIAATLRELGASRRVTLGLTAVATLNTEVLRHAFEPRYDLAVAALIALLVWSVARLARPATAGSVVLPSVIATVLVMTRALYHPLWLLGTLAFLLWTFRERLDGRRLAIAIGVPLLVVGGWIVKNEVKFGEPTLSSWTGMNLLRSVQPAVDPDRIAELRARGTVSDVAVLGPFRGYSAYAAVVPPCSPTPGSHPVLTEVVREIPEFARAEGIFARSDAPNFNYECYLPVYRQAGDDAIALITAEPGAWVRARVWSINNWFEADGAEFGESSLFWPALAGASRVGLLAVPHPGLPRAWQDSELWVHSTRLSITHIVATIAVLVAGIRAVPRLGRTRAGNHRAGRQRAIVTILVATIVAWTMVAGTLLELGEQSRFRNAIDPLVLAIGGLILVDRWKRWMTDRREAAPDELAPAGPAGDGFERSGIG